MDDESPSWVMVDTISPHMAIVETPEGEDVRTFMMVVYGREQTDTQRPCVLTLVMPIPVSVRLANEIALANYDSMSEVGDGE